MDAGAEPLDGRFISWARSTARELGIDLVAGSIVERVPGKEKTANTSVHVGPDGEVRAVYRKLHMFDVEVDGDVYAESATEDPGEEVVLSELAGGMPLGMSICYDVRFPELYRILAVRGAQVVTRAGRLHAGHHARPLGGAAARPGDREPVLRGRPEPDRSPSARPALRRSLDDHRPVGPDPGPGVRRRDRDRGRSGPGHARAGPAPDPGPDPPPARDVRLGACDGRLREPQPPTSAG